LNLTLYIVTLAGITATAVNVQQVLKFAHVYE